ncbi:MAG: hypothetical protein QCI00_09850, partial [Candidatus Thermoplasmatota archaeon]|nr:hypothetical protein [Candidatus Thermoplasmatota archaeon]
ILHVSNNNHIVGQSSCWQSSFDFYTSKIFLKNQHLDLKRYKDLTTFIQLFILEYSQDLKQRLFYFPVYPPVKSENLVNTDYFYIANNKEGVTLHTSFNNTLKYIWIENKNEGIRIINSSIYPNFIISNFIYKNKAGINATNSLVTSIFINNLYDNDNALLLNNCTGIPISNKGLISFIIGGNVIINTKKTLPRFEWIFLDKTTNLIFIDLISLTFVAGYAITSSLLTIAILFSSMFSTPLLTVMLSTIFFLISISPLLIRRIKINQPQPVFNMGY